MHVIQHVNVIKLSGLEIVLSVLTLTNWGGLTDILFLLWKYFWSWENYTRSSMLFQHELLVWVYECVVVCLCVWVYMWIWKYVYVWVCIYISLYAYISIDMCIFNYFSCSMVLQSNSKLITHFLVLSLQDNVSLI